MPPATLARRHAPGAAVDVELDYGLEALHLKVRDNGPGPGGGQGHGLTGMYERVAMLGGFLRTGPAPVGGFVVETDDVGHLHNFLLPGAGRTVSEITPVSDKPMPKPD